MNIRFYLTLNWKRDLPEAKIVYRDGDLVIARLAGHSVQGPNTIRPFIDFGNDSKEAFSFSGRFRDFIESVSVVGRLPIQPKRTRGDYVLRTAEGDLERITKDGQERYEYRITSTRRVNGVHAHAASVYEALLLVAQIREGTIRPKRSWDKPQIGTEPRRVRKHLRDRTRPYFRLHHATN